MNVTLHPAWLRPKRHELTMLSIALVLVLGAIGAMTLWPESYLLIPWFPWVLCIVALGLIFAMIYYLYSSLTKGQFLCSFVLAYALASLFWLFNFTTFYDVMASTRWVEANIVRHVVTFVLSRDDLNNLAKGEILRSILMPGNELKRTGAQVVVKDDTGLTIFEKANGRPEYIPEVFDTRPLVVNGKTYAYTYQYNNRPDLWTGYARAVSLSLLYPQGVYDWRLFMIYKLYNRSSYFYVVFLLMLVITPLGFAWRNSEKQKLQALQTFQNAYSKLSNDFAIGVNNSENNLQQIQSHMDALINERKSLELSLKESAGLGRHDILNRIKSVRTDMSVYENQKLTEQCERLNHYLLETPGYNQKILLQDIYDVIFSPWIAKIHDELKSLDTTLEVNIQTCSVATVLAIVQKAIPENIQAHRIFDLTYTFTTHVKDGEAIYVTIITSKLQSIVFNIVQNSLQQMERYMDSLDDDALDDYTRLLSLAIEQDNSYIHIYIRDNGGGFPKGILHKIYKEPIPTAKNDGRTFGLGTSYIRFFIDFMPGVRIEASNYRIPETKEVGACTKLSIPYMRKNK